MGSSASDRLARGDAKGCSALGIAYTEGFSIPVDVEQAARWLERGCALKHRESCANLGSLLVKSGGLSDFDRGLKLLTETCEAKAGAGCASLGVIYESGIGVAPNPQRALALYRLACSYKSSSGCFEFARARAAAGPDDPAELAAIIALLEQSCELGHIDGCTKVGLVYRDGIEKDGVEKTPPDADAAFRWLARGCELRPSIACVHLAIAHFEGTGTPRDPARAVELLETNCAAGIGWGCMMLATMLLKGDDVELDEARARVLVELGCELDQVACEMAGEYGLR
jgi:uncharacterized protein